MNGIKGIFQEIAKWGEFVKISHTVFALPFALASMLVAARENRGWPGWRLFLLILGAMVTARTCAMTFNRIVDRHFDKLNTRTASRHLPTGAISLCSARLLLITSGAAFIYIAYHINTICFYLSPVALFVVCFYSLTKRFTDYTHVYLGIALGLAPIGAWLAVAESLSLAPILLSIAVVFWLIGFDIIYAMQDHEFDRKHGLHSVVVGWGVKNALQGAFLSHMIMWGVLAIFGFLQSFRLAYITGLSLILIALVMEHWLARKRSLKWINYSFFRLNAMISLIFLIVTALEVIFPFWRFRV
jgi:4-hydroxybenzoate polyprenyltransferase